MTIRSLALLMVLLATPFALRAQTPTDVCPLWIGVGPHGTLYELSPRGLPPVKTDLSRLRDHLMNGCQASRLSPSRVTSVTVKIAPHSLRGTTSTVFNLLAQQGWPRSRVLQAPWSGAPR